MTIQEAKEMFPYAVKVTSLVIKKADNEDAYLNIGAKVLRKSLDSKTVLWYKGSGRFRVEGIVVDVYSTDNHGNSIDMRTITEPRIVILTLDRPKNYRIEIAPNKI